jgi:hypothetical protein
VSPVRRHRVPRRLSMAACIKGESFAKVDGQPQSIGFVGWSKRQVGFALLGLAEHGPVAASEMSETTSVFDDAESRAQARVDPSGQGKVEELELWPRGGEGEDGDLQSVVEGRERGELRCRHQFAEGGWAATGAGTVDCGHGVTASCSRRACLPPEPGTLRGRAFHPGEADFVQRQ